MIHNNLPQSGPNENISDLLLNEQILFDPMRDPVYTSSTIKFDNNVLSSYKVLDFLHLEKFLCLLLHVRCLDLY